MPFLCYYIAKIPKKQSNTILTIPLKMIKLVFLLKCKQSSISMSVSAISSKPQQLKFHSGTQNIISVHVTILPHLQQHQTMNIAVTIIFQNCCLSSTQHHKNHVQVVKLKHLCHLSNFQSDQSISLGGTMIFKNYHSLSST